MKSKIFLLSLSVLLLFAGKATACGGGDLYEGPLANLFFMVEPLDKEETGVDEIQQSIDFWYSYLGGAVSKESLRSSIYFLSIEDLLKPAETENELVSILYKRKDRVALTYLQINQKLYDLCNWGRNWEYKKPADSEYKALVNELAKVTPNAKLKDRFAFLRMRCLYNAKQYDDVLSNWKMYGAQVTDASLKRRMQGYVGGVYYQKGKYEEALEIFTALGDQRSINRFAEKMLDPEKLEPFYDKNPNSVVLLYVMQDYANYIYHACNSDGDWGSMWPQVRRDYDRMYAFTQKVLAEKKAKDLMPWQAFKGFLEYSKKDYETAYNSFGKAQQMGGSKGQQSVVRYLKLLASFEIKNKPADFTDYVLAETKALRQEAYAETDGNESVFRGPLWNIYVYDLPQKLYAYCGKIGDTQSQKLVLALFGNVPSGDMYIWWRDYIDHEISTADLIKFRERLKNPDKKNKLECVLAAMVSADEPMRMDELIGTKFMREGNYDMAIEYLSKVSQNYLEQQAIAPYLNLRKLPEVHFGRCVTNDLECVEVANCRNVKLEFATRMRDNLKKLKSLKGDVKAEMAYQMARELYQASPCGDLWAISEYYWSSADNHHNQFDDQAIELLKIAIKSTKDFSILRKCYIGLASVPNNNEDRLTYDYETRITTINVTGSVKEGYAWLLNNLPGNDEFRKTCDNLALYAKSYK